MALISAMVDLKLGLLIIESPRCTEKLQIELKSGQSFAGKEIMEIYSQRYEITSPVPYFCIKDTCLLPKNFCLICTVLHMLLAVPRQSVDL